MNDWNEMDYGMQDPVYQEPYQSSLSDRTSVSEVVTGAFMYMFIALLVTGITGVLIASSETALRLVFSSSATFIGVIVLELVVAFAARAAMNKNSVVLSAVLFFAYAFLNGVTFSVIFIAYTKSTINRAFLITAVMFGVMAFIGKVTDVDLTKLGNILLIGLVGVIVASLINIFIGSTMLELGITVIAIVIFLGLTAYDMQKIQRIAAEGYGMSPAVVSLWGAMELYLDFINLFLRVLQLMGRKK